MSGTKDFFSNPERIVQAIKEAELNTSGEIKVHIETTCEGDVMDRAKEVFQFLKIDKLPNKNGVLIYISVDDHKLCILGDQRLDVAVEANYWQAIVQRISISFQKNKFDEGVIQAISEIGEKMKHHFPYDAKTDINELNDEISYGE